MRAIIILSIICLSVNASATNVFKRVGRQAVRSCRDVGVMAKKDVSHTACAQPVTITPANVAGSAAGTKKITLCGERLDVPVLFYAACFGISATLPANCTGGAALSAGSSCYAAVSAMSITCGVSVATLLKIAKACIEDDK